MEISYKFRIYPSSLQIKQIQQNFGCSRFVYNYYLEKRKKLWEESKQTFNYYCCANDLTKLKKEFEWLKQSDSTSLQSSLKDLDIAFQNYFKNNNFGYPKFKTRKRHRKAYRTKNNGSTIAICGGKLKLPRLGLVKCKFSKQVNGRILSATVSQNPSGKYFVSLSCTDVNTNHYKNTGKQVGVDLGIKDLAITSDGKKYQNHKFLKQSERKIARFQRQLSRKTSGSNRYEKARLKLARLHEHVANQRMDAMQKLTTELVSEYDTICIENLNTNGMRKNHKIAKSVMDASFFEFRRELEYKTKWYGKKLIIIDRFFPSSQMCSCCGAQWKALKDLSQRSWICPSCMTHHDRDINASKNILREGLKSVS